MHHPATHYLGAKLCLLAVLTVVVSSQVSGTTHYTGHRAAVVSVGDFTYLDQAELSTDDLIHRTAARLKKRLRASQIPSPGVEEIAKAVAQRQALLKAKTTLTIVEPSHKTHTHSIAVSAHPTWIEGRFRLSRASFTLNPQRIAAHVTQMDLPGLLDPTDVVIQDIQRREENAKAVTSDIAKPGVGVDKARMSRALHAALLGGRESVEVDLHVIPGSIANHTGKNLGTLSLLASGRSNFRGSTLARMHNVKKALGQHVHNTLVGPGETFSFNSTLEGRVTLGNGWKMAKVIVNGDELVPQPGGGICQASTTTYRAILNAGFPVVSRRNHSMYISYYEAFGIGKDATIYPGQQDLAFVNDTSHPLLIQAYTEGHDAYVNIYGTPDGRQVAMEGPYFRSTAPEGFRVKNRTLGNNEIAWVQHVVYADGSERTETILSRYRDLPSSIAWKYKKPERTLLSYGQ